MGAKSGVALKFLQWFVRAIQFGCCAVVLALYSYFLATMHNHDIDIPNWVRAVEGISGVGVLYTLTGLLLLCCFAGHRFTSMIAIILDVCFIAAFIYVAVSNRGGASSCTGDSLYTPLGTGSADDKPTASDGFTNLPTYREACRMESACLAVAIVAIFFFVFSIIVEVALVRHHRKEARFGPSPANNYTSGSGGGRGFFSRFRRRGTAGSQYDNPNALPVHTTPDQIRTSYNTETTAVGHDHSAYNKYGESGFDPNGHTAYPETGVTSAAPGAHHRYNDGTYNV
ncbi:hypothetical protein BX600DRAFT_472429 [Xylariales sp. PMI_506]|nr:hypothetical protein BX600DRAFT_472429 [Xylariales sp. PMI_506]